MDEELKIDESGQERQPGWMKFFGALKEHPEEVRRINAAIEEEFERIDPEAWA